MPIYEYRCTACEHQLEVLQKMNDAALEDCPACGRPDLRKMISAAVFRLKGGGWYETDFKSGDKKNIAGDKASSSSDSLAGESSSSKDKAKPGSDSGSSSSSGSDSSSSSNSNSSSSSGNSAAAN